MTHKWSSSDTVWDNFTFQPAKVDIVVANREEAVDVADSEASLRLDTIDQLRCVGGNDRAERL